GLRNDRGAGAAEGHDRRGDVRSEVLAGDPHRLVAGRQARVRVDAAEDELLAGRDALVLEPLSPRDGSRAGRAEVEDDADVDLLGNSRIRKRASWRTNLNGRIRDTDDGGGSAAEEDACRRGVGSELAAVDR